MGAYIFSMEITSKHSAFWMALPALTRMILIFLFYLGRTQVELGHLVDAVATFEKLISKQQNYPRALYTLGQTYWKLGKKGDAHYYLGIHYKNKREFKTAIFHLKKASENINEPYKKAKIEELLKGIRKKKSESEKDDNNKAQKN